MSFTPQAESFAGYENNRFVTKEEVYFDELIHGDKLDDAADFISEHVDTLGYEIREYGYNSRFFRAALKEVAMPMYRKMYSDKHFSQYPNFRDEIKGMYPKAVNLMRLLGKMREGDGIPADSFTDETYNDIRGDMSELTVFALATRNMHGSDDITIMPSDVRQDIAGRDKDGRYQGFDFTVYDRLRSCPYPLQVKTNRTTKEYHPFIAVLPLSYFVEPLHISIEELQDMIMADSDRSSHFLHKAGRRMNGILSNALKDVFDTTDALDARDRKDAANPASA